MKLEWSDDALADLDRFAEFLQERYPSLAKIVASEIIEKAQTLDSRAPTRPGMTSAIFTLDTRFFDDRAKMG